ncbi:MAG: ABC transporter six-transmembrane domain-containing protein [Pseudomonadota bacterium]
MLSDSTLSLGTLLRLFPGRIALTWAMTLIETAFLALVPLFIGIAIDGLLDGTLEALWHLTALFGGLIAVSVLRRIHDTRVYGAVRVRFGVAQVNRGSTLPISALNAQLGMGRELVEFLEETVPMVMTGVVQLVIAIVVLFTYAPVLAGAAGLAALGVLVIYALFHRLFFRMNSTLNAQIEKQVDVLELRSARPALAHFMRLRRSEVRISDTEALLYGLVFVVLLAAALFNLWFATTALALSTGAIFAVVSYTWDFVDGTLTLPMTLQSWTRLSEITRRLNAPGQSGGSSGNRSNERQLWRTRCR